MKSKPITINNLTAADFPPAVRPFWESVPNNQKLRLALTLTSIVCYCGLSPRLRVKYTYDPEVMQGMLLLNLLVIGPSGSGKSAIRWAVNMLMNAQILRDSEERRKFREFKEKSKKERERIKEPLVVCRFLQKATIPVIVKYSDLIHRRYKDWLSFFLYGDELAAFTENRRGNNDFQAVARTSYELGETYSRDTLYQDGYNALVDVLWNSVICGQERALEKYIDKEGVVLGDAGRQMLIMLDDGLGEDAPTIRPFTEEQQRIVDQTVAQLMAETFTDDDQLVPTHKVDMEWLDKDVKHWCRQIRVQILKNGSHAMNSFYVRASKSAFRISTMLYHLWGEDETRRKQVRRCYFFFAQMILDNAMAQWGQDYESAIHKDKENVSKKPSLYDQMPKRWTRTQLREIVIKEGIATEARQFIHKWLKKKWIHEVEPDVYEKVE